MKHYAIGNKTKLFKRFDKGDRPSDIGSCDVKRRTLYQYYGEWRREKGIQGKRTGFATSNFNRKAFLIEKEKEKRRVERERERERLRQEKEELNRHVMDWEALVEALKRWDGYTRPGPSVYLLGSRRYSFLVNCLRLQKLSDGTMRTLSKEENLALLEKWIEVEEKSRGISDFLSRCDKEAAGIPPELTR